MASKRRVFNSVFQFSGAVSQPTPDIDFAAPGQAFGGPLPFAHDRAQAPDSLTRAFNVSMSSSADVRDQITWDQSWHTVTGFLVLPFMAGGFSANDDASLPTPSPAFHSALKNVLDPEGRLPYAMQTEDLILWYSQQVRYHFLHEVLAILSRASNKSKQENVLHNCVMVLQRAHRLYLHGLSFVINQLDNLKPDTSRSRISAFRRDLHALVSKAIARQVSGPIKAMLAERVGIILGIPAQQLAGPLLDGRQAKNSAGKAKARVELLNSVEKLHEVGLGGEKMKIIFAEVMNEAMSSYVQRTYSRVWSKMSVPHDNEQESQSESAPGGGVRDVLTFESIEDTPLIPRTVNHGSTSQCTKELCEWIESEYSTLILDVLRKLDQTEVDWTHVENWKKMSIGRLAGLRTQELFDIIESWPTSHGALDDLRTAIDTPQRRLKLTDVFSASLKTRLLHPGTSTLQILRTYISMIWSFHSLDHSKVLLDRVAYPLQVYLCSREDTVRIIIAGLLSDTEDAFGVLTEPGGDKLTELAILLNKGAEGLEQKADEDLDWNDMEWVPDPVDAGPGYKRSKSADVIGTLIGVLGSQEVFIKEFQSIIGDNLLRSEGDFEKELKLLELLKTRFGEAPLQNCEVMIKDIQDSRRVDGVIRRNQRLDPNAQEIAAAKQNSEMQKKDHTNPEGLLKPSIHAKILSRLFWPQLHSEDYRVPDDIAQLQQSYEQGFEALKNSRKLTWIQGLGHATVELQLQDRVILEEVHTWQATVIWAFQGPEEEEVEEEQGEDNSTTRSVGSLVEHLAMDETLVRSALKFWTGKMVLREVRKDEYVVLETLNQEDRARSDAQAAGAAVTGLAESGGRAEEENSTLMSNADLTSEKMQMYWQFIQGMLTNSSPQMPLQQIAMMLKMLIVDGFPYSNEELQEFLNTKVAAGDLEFIAGKYKLRK